MTNIIPSYNVNNAFSYFTGQRQSGILRQKLYWCWPVNNQLPNLGWRSPSGHTSTIPNFQATDSRVLILLRIIICSFPMNWCVAITSTQCFAAMLLCLNELHSLTYNIWFSILLPMLRHSSSRLFVSNKYEIEISLICHPTKFFSQFIWPFFQEDLD